MSFAEKQLSKHGWSKGQGLGREQSGITEAIKVKVKQDKVGVGHDPGEEFSFHWWDHVFNKAASKIEVKTTEDGVEIQNSGETRVSKKKNSKAYANKAMLYGQFVKGSTLTGGIETREATRDESSDEEERETTQCLMPDQEDVVFQKCGGRTAHKGARHGLKLNGKLQRIEEQEKLLAESYKAKSAKAGKEKHHSKGTVSAELLADDENATKCGEKVLCESGDTSGCDTGLKVSKKKKKKKKRETDELENSVNHEENMDNEILKDEQTFENHEVVESKKSKKRKAELLRREDCENQDSVCEGEAEEKQKAKKRKKSKKSKDRCKEQSQSELSDKELLDDHSKESSMENSSSDKTSDLNECSDGNKKKKRKQEK